MVLQYVKPSIFTDFIQLQQENKLDEILSYYQEIENEKESDEDQNIKSKANNLKKEKKIDKKWKDEWFEQWVRIEPNLIDHDLKPYFYLSRNKGLDSITFGKALSNDAVQVIRAYLSGNDIAKLNAEENINNLSSVELNLIVEQLSEEFIKQPEDKRLGVFKGLIDLSTKRNECADFVVRKISELPINYMTKSMKMYANNLIDLEIPASSEMSKVVNSWNDK